MRPVLGFWFVVVLPAYLIFTTSAWRKCGPQERLGYSVCATILTLMLMGLVINEVLPFAGVQRPLTASIIIIASDVINLSLYLIRSRYPDKVRLGVSFSRFSKQEFRLLVGAALAVVLAIFGANHLNNGASGNISLIALVVMGLVGVFAVRWLRFTRESVISVVIYLVSLGLLLGTSLRGWYITGHDIQQEYLVFQLTEAHARWSMSYFQDNYNACLSITIFPTELGQILNVDSPYVFKVFFQLLFALCPVLAYTIARRFFSRGIATLSVAYFVSFPTFFTDMPFLNRQEMALLFVAVGLLAATNPAWSFRRRQVSFGIAGLGTELSHYSTMYILVGTLVFGLLLSYASRLIIKPDPAEAKPQAVRRDVRYRGRRMIPTIRGAVTIGLLVGFIGIVLAWGTLATRTTTSVVSDGQAAIEAGNISLSGLFAGSSTQATLIQELQQQGLQDRATSAPGTYLPWSAVSSVHIPVVQQPLTPLTKLGGALNSAGIPVSLVNSLTHSLESAGIDLFLAIGLITLFIQGWRRGRIVGGQFYWLGVGCFGMILLVGVVPSISADYGVLRAFQQGLLFFSPVIVVGSMTIFARIGQHRARIASCVLCLGVFLVSTTLAAQVLGNNQAQLNLNNSGYYYDLYYKTPQDSAALTWLDDQPNALNYPIQASWDSRRFLFSGPSVVSGSEQVYDEYPTLITENSWVILDDSTTGSDLAFSYNVASNGIIEYKYPVGLLNKYKDLVYTDGDVVIYK